METTRATHQAAVDYIDGLRDRIVSALPGYVSKGVFLSAAIEFLIANPKALSYDRQSLDRAIIGAAFLGFPLGEPFSLATIGGFKNRRESASARLASLMIEYRGHMALVYRSSRVVAIEARPVYSADAFDYDLGPGAYLHHKKATEADRGALVHAYALARLPGNNTSIEVITRHEAEQARKDSPNAHKSASLWQTRPAAMWCKTAIRKLTKHLPRAGADRPETAGRIAGAAAYKELINAILMSPELYKKAIDHLSFEFPIDPDSIAIVLDTMRDLYKAEQKGARPPAQ